MSKTIYWAVLLDEKNRAVLLSHISPRHANVYAEHMTLAFAPEPDVDERLTKLLGVKVDVTVISVHSDDKGQAVGAFGDIISRIDKGHGHITISCAEGTKPVYSNELIKSDIEKGLICTISPFHLEGVVAKFTNSGWIKS